MLTMLYVSHRRLIEIFMREDVFIIVCFRQTLYQNPKSSKAFLVQGPSHTGQETSRQPPVARENLLSTAGCK